MPYLIKWSEQAQLDLIRLYRFLEPKGQNAAGRAVDAIRLGTMILAQHPEVGRPIADAPQELRDWIIPFGASAYIVRYFFDGRQAVLLAIRHGREVGF